MKPQILFPSLVAFLLAPSVAYAGATDDFSACESRASDWKEPFHTGSGGIRDGCWDDFHITALRHPYEVQVCSFHECPDQIKEYLPEQYWDEGWGYTDHPTLSHNYTAYCIMAESFSVLERVAARGSEVPGNNFVLREAFDYVLEHTVHYRPNCYKEVVDGKPDAHSGALEFTLGLGRDSTKMYDTYFESGAAARAKLLLHEAWHRGSGRTHEVIKEVYYLDGEKTKIRVDHRYQDIYSESDHLNDHGVSTYSIDVAWLEGYARLPQDPPSATRRAISSNQREAAIDSANLILATKFEIPTLKRVSAFTEQTIFEAMNKGSTALAEPFEITGVVDSEGSTTGSERGLMLAFPEEPCGLLGINGAFRKRGDRARIVKRDLYSGLIMRSAALKYLDVQTVHEQESRIVGAQAACFPGVEVVFEGHFIAAEDDFPDGAHESEPFGGGFRYSGDILDEAGDPLYPAQTACFLTGVEGRLQGEAEQMGLQTVDSGSNDGRWQWYIEGNTKDENNYLRMDVACIKRPRSETLQAGTINIRSDSVWVNPLKHEDDVAYPSHSCVLASVTGRMFNQHDLALIREHDFLDPIEPRRTYTCAGQFDGFGNQCTTWDLIVAGDNHLLDYNTRVKATCFEY